MILSRYTLDNYENLQSGWLVSGYRFELDTLGTQHLETSGNIIPLDTDTRKADGKYFPCFGSTSFLHETTRCSEIKANIYSQTRAKRDGVFYLQMDCNKPFVPGTILSGILFTMSRAAEICYDILQSTTF
jgi:hypothetical protein